jgi:hypothetical protein
MSRRPGFGVEVLDRLLPPEIPTERSKMAARQPRQTDVAQLVVGHLPQQFLVAPNPQKRPLRRQETLRHRQEISSQAQQRVTLRVVGSLRRTPLADRRHFRPFE